MINVRPAFAYIGRRGAFLLFLAQLDMLYGQSLLSPLPYGLHAAQIYAPFVLLAPLHVWAAAWIVAGAACLTGVLARPLRPYAFAAAGAINTAWGVGYVIGWQMGAFPQGIKTASIWLGFAGLVLIESGRRGGDAR